MKERRRYARIGIALPIKYKIINKSGWHKTSSLNISAGGVLIPTVPYLDVGTKLDLQIYLPGEKKPIKAIGRVIWRKPAEIWEGFKLSHEMNGFFAGIEFAKFTKIKEDNTVKIMEFIYECLHDKDFMKKFKE